MDRKDVSPSPVFRDPAVSCIEFTSIARGIKTCDEMAKKAAVNILESATICPGKFIVLIGGEVGPVEESHNRGIEIGGESVVDSLFLPNAHPQLFPAITATTVIEKVDAIGVVETLAVASCILGADAAAKAAEITLIELRLARGLAGKGFFTLTGPLYQVEAAVEAATRVIRESSALLLRTEIIPHPHPDMVKTLL